MESKSKPFVCLDVDDQSTLRALSKRIEEFFPDNIVRLKINGNYSPFFYMDGRWIYKPKLTKPAERFTFKIFTNDTAEQFLEKDHILQLKQLNVDTANIKLAGDIYLVDQNLPGFFFTDGETIVVYQALLENAKKLSNFLNEFLDCKIVLDIMNEENSGIIVLQTKNNTFGVKNGQNS